MAHDGVRVRVARRRRCAGIIGAAAIGLGALVAGLLVAPTQAAQPDDSQVVRSGDARFEVLSPTLIRMEYAGDGTFTDQATYNAIGRDSFAPADFTSQVSDGWLTIDTGQATLRYKVGSGPFTADNVSLTLHTSGQTVTGHPTFPSAAVCTVGTLCEGEAAQLVGASVATDHNGYTGSGFAAGFDSAGSSLTYPLDVPEEGTYDLRLRYANATGGDGQMVTRTMSAAVDNGTPTTVTLPVTGSWDTWALAAAPGLHLTAGTHTLVISHTPADSGHINIDSLALTPPGDPYPAPSTTVTPCAYGTVCEAEDGTLAGGASPAHDHNYYSGTGFAAGLTRAGASVSIPVTGVPADGSYDLQLRYANVGTPRIVSVAVGGGTPANATLAPTYDWDTWSTAHVPVTLTKGDDTVTVGCPTADSCHLNIDTVALTQTGAPTLLAHSPLGGYRRGLDGVNGSATTVPGLLYRDGWSLLDDTASALLDPQTGAVTQRPDHGGQPYQDGYLFAYGADYQQGLRDLATLTGPSMLLPRWAYGVWFSEYYNYTAADYENTILPAFRREGVPLDVLVTDTDFKSPGTWNGWEMDPQKFPDPAAYFAWAHSQGLHTTLNVHSSIADTDPQFPQAQATAKGKLSPVSDCHGLAATCYVWDWGDPDQLASYFSVHQQIEQQGDDFWWLDWCCDQSISSLAGVTPDAWINQAYADDTSKNIGRGFSLARAFGSLQTGAGAVPTGPWADKRSTVHFTGDTTSTWSTLAYEVGYTPGESAATGLSPISHDIGGFNNDGTQTRGANPGSTKEADDLYIRWVQLGTFQPILRLHGNHSDRLPWQYGDAARTAADSFFNLRENLVPYTYSLAQQATQTGVPVVRPTYLEYPDQQAAYDFATREYFYGPDVLVAPATSPGTTATTTVWFPPGSSWTDWFTGQTYAGGTTAQVTTGWEAMPVFVRSGGIVATRSHDVANDVQNPLTDVTLTVAAGGPGSFRLYEDDGHSAHPASANTLVTYAENGGNHLLTIHPADGSYPGQVDSRAWTVVLRDIDAPSKVLLNGQDTGGWTYDTATRTLTMAVPARSVHRATVISVR